MTDQDKVTMLVAALLAISTLKVEPDSDPAGTLVNIQAMAARVIERVKEPRP